MNASTLKSHVQDCQEPSIKPHLAPRSELLTGIAATPVSYPEGTIMPSVLAYFAKI
jgi:hypothetical protein